MSSWRKAGLTYNAYLNIAAKTVRAALKPEARTPAVLSRDKVDSRYTKYEKGEPLGEPKPLSE
ncbi:ATP15 (YPL271W) [Zygosaccharomyces parabailii]|uniref:ZYBA0S17-00298g1_1 n=1 Tax=Zygosaccharomyces bailii (strain CLIB 213 / ATCC 58445 / CBS 680 / BCRC 21525 / NBRC 1098 / NCYC 1416 / NRRL Y-2227) TaxID=1333698 RepID=A0A8J2X5J8_ZYGB2|nr:ATP15 (YPL271W) [Zygosaccharomyces parabailii]AQZ18482.1 ATP15 (YPL271W) [Zygosaccharomyces parabailii]CDF91982.1 ZYBA0S17-00298g1_1 [Zygosaccharomyces bailii CLIB 213]CDH16758.1 uncharacterized protein ZBAI_08546 [Zygosaccharomyces bailii ISA1307]SJM88584.1 uncharacterized protein ZBIST_4773 [Zygosaccharomyces bailii]